MINESKPNVGTPQTELNIGGGFNLLIGGVYRLIVGAVGLAGMTNTTRASLGETWGTIASTWENETRSWLASSSLFTNFNKSTVNDSYELGNPLDNSDWALYTPYTKEVQSFTATAGTIESVKFYISKLAISGTVSAVLYNHSGVYGISSVPTGAVLATSESVDLETIATPNFDYPPSVVFTFKDSNRVSLVEGQKYCIGIVFVGGDASHFVSILIDTVSPSHSGNLAEWDGAAWVPYPQYDAFFELRTSSLISNISKPV